MRTHRLGASVVLLELDLAPSPPLSRRLAETARRLRAQPGVLDAVPAYASIAVHHDPEVLDAAEALRLVEETVRDVAAGDVGDAGTAIVPVRYDGPDLGDAAAALRMSAAELVERHARPLYTVAMIGFQPHFPYLLGLDPLLHLPRRERPRTRVEPGAVAIAGEQAGIYPGASPGGWHCIGRTDPAICRTLEAGMQLRFVVADG